MTPHAPPKCSPDSADGDAPEAGAPEIEKALDELAERLRWQMERLDPSDNSTLTWAQLPEDDRRLFRLCVEDLMRYRDLIRILQDYKGKPTTT